MPVRKLWPMLVPIVALAAVLLARPAGRLGASVNGTPEVRWLIDDIDAAGRILRGLNANEGRLAGKTAEPPGVEYELFLKSGSAALEPRYFLEYPQAALAVFQIVIALSDPQWQSLPNDLLDSLYHNIAHHAPQGENERLIWASFHRIAAAFNILFCLALLLMMWLLRDGPIVLLALPGAVYFSLHRYDILPSLAVLLALFATDRKRPFLAGSWLGFAIMLKAYPLILAPILLRSLGWRVLPGIAWPIAVFLGYAVAHGDWQAMAEPYCFQLSRSPEPESALYGNLLPLWLGGPGLAGLVRNGIMLLAVLALCRTKANSLNDLLRKCALAVLVFTALQVFYSHQWLLWLTPLCIPLAAKDRRIFWILFALDLVNYLSFPIVYDLSRSMNLDVIRVALIVVRAILWIALAICLLRVRE